MKKIKRDSGRTNEKGSSSLKIGKEEHKKKKRTNVGVFDTVHM
jgi:hypothetical protein